MKAAKASNRLAETMTWALNSGLTTCPDLPDPAKGRCRQPSILVEHKDSWRAARDKSENFYTVEITGKLDEWLSRWKKMGFSRSGDARRNQFCSSTSRVRELLSLTGTRPLSGGEIVQVFRAEFGIPYALAYTTVKRAVLRFDPESWAVQFPRSQARRQARESARSRVPPV